MANPRQLALLKRSVREWNMWRKRSTRGWNIWRKAHSAVQVDLNGANLYGSDLYGANLSKANLSKANLNRANLSEANLSGADLNGAGLYGADLKKANLRGADLREADLRNANLSGADLNGAFLTMTLLPMALLKGDDPAYLRSEAAFVLPYGSTGTDLPKYRLHVQQRSMLSPKSTTSRPQPSQSSTTNWLSLVETVGIDLFVSAATLASIIQGLDVIERRWREHQAKRQQRGTPHAPTSPQKLPAPDTEITEILLVMDDGSHHTFERWISDPDTLRAYIDAFSDPTSKVRPIQMVFRKRKGRSLRVNVTEGGKDNRQLNVILGYLEADPQ